MLIDSFSIRLQSDFAASISQQIINIINQHLVGNMQQKNHKVSSKHQ
jgi:hypothetical protein